MRNWNADCYTTISESVLSRWKIGSIDLYENVNNFLITHTSHFIDFAQSTGLSVSAGISEDVLTSDSEIGWTTDGSGNGSDSSEWANSLQLKKFNDNERNNKLNVPYHSIAGSTPLFPVISKAFSLKYSDPWNQSF